MKILILEDDLNKKNAINDQLQKFIYEIEVVHVVDFQSFHTAIERDKFDLIIADLIVPLFKGMEESDVTQNIVESVRDIECCNFRTPVVALTQFSNTAEDNFRGLNNKDILVLTYHDDENSPWRSSLMEKLALCVPPLTYDFIIVCALEKEAAAYLSIDKNIEKGTKSYQGFDIRNINISDKNGIIITSPRMGLVSSSIVCARAIEVFKPKIICMSGICAGFSDKSNIYDVIIPDICHQHDSGKWDTDGFSPEIYSVQVNPDVRSKINEIIGRSDFKIFISDGIRCKKSEIPDDKEYFEFNVILGPASSGSSVVADEEMASEIKKQHRKAVAFEMETFALYEAARLSPSTPKFFSAKAVVDNGNAKKGDAFHTVASLVSAKCVYKILEGLL